MTMRIMVGVFDISGESGMRRQQGGKRLMSFLIGWQAADCTPTRRERQQTFKI